MHLGEHGAVLDVRLRFAPDISRVVQQRNDHAQNRAPRTELARDFLNAVVAFDQPSRGERYIKRVTQVVIKRVAGQVIREGAFE